MTSRALATLRVLGPDSKGIVAACVEVLNRQGCAIVKGEHETDRRRKIFYQRLLFDGSSVTSREQTLQEFDAICTRFGIRGDIDWRDEPKRVAVMVSKFDHCLWELLLRHKANELDCTIPLVISNHAHLQHVAETFGIPYHIIPITPESKYRQEQKQLQLLQEHQIDTVVLARYMQVLSNDFLKEYPDRVINIHHSFLPAFSGGRAYHQAHSRGVKLIGATAHYATTDLDEGPIIEQDVISVSHRDEPNDFVRKGRILERNVLTRALQAHLDNRTLIYDNKCVVFME